MSAPFFIAVKDDQIIGICVAILRNINACSNEKAWYLCDLKVHPKHQGRFIVQKILNHAFAKCSAISKKVYGVSMNSAEFSYNKIAKFAKRLPYLNIKEKGILEFYMLDQSQTESQNFIEDNKNQFLSLSGIKDLVLESSGKPLDFMHYTSSVQKDLRTSGQTKFMVCCPPNSLQSNAFKKQQIYPVTTATILANFESDNWDFIKSSDI